MALADNDPPKRKVLFPGGEFEVRAITLPDVAIIVDSHRFVIDRIVTQLRARGELNLENPETLVDTLMEVIRESPILVANIISTCADEQDQMGAAMRLPLPVVVEALQTIGSLTFKDLAAVKKFVADVMKLIRGILPPQTETAAAA